MLAKNNAQVKLVYNLGAERQQNVLLNSIGFFGWDTFFKAIIKKYLHFVVRIMYKAFCKVTIKLCNLKITSPNVLCNCRGILDIGFVLWLLKERTW